MSRRIALAVGGWFLLVTTWGVALPARAQQREAEPPPAPPEVGERQATPGEATPEQRPAFVLPDVVVTGEDQSRLAGGARLLGADVPRIAAEQQPLLIDPGPTQYRRRLARPFEVGLPPRAMPARPRALLRARAAQGPLGSLSLLAIPSASQGSLLWLDLDGWRERVPDRRHGAAEFGWRTARPPAQTHRRMGLELRSMRETWLTASRQDREGVLRGFAGRAFLEGRGRIASAPFVWGGGLRGGAARTRYWSSVQGTAQRSSASAEWIAVLGELQTENVAGDLRDRPGGSGLLCDLRGGYVQRDGPTSGAQHRGRWSGSLGWRQPLAGGALQVGIGGGGEGRTSPHVWAPHLSFERLWRTAGLDLRLVLSPEITFVDELPTRGARWSLTRGTLGRQPRLLESQAPAVFDPALAPQRAWPRGVLELFRQARRWVLAVGAEAARWEDPLDWRHVPGTVTPRLYTPVNAPARWVFEVRLAADGRLADDVTLLCRYRGLRESRIEAAGSRLLFLPHSELSAALRATPGRWLLEFNVQGRGRTSAGDTLPPLAAFVTWGARLGLRLGGSEVALVAENLTASDVALRPDEILGERWFGIEWNHAFMTHVP